MDLQISNTPAGTIITLGGRFDAAAVAAARSSLERIPAEGRHDVYIDLSRVTFIDSSALGLCVFLFKRLAAERRKLFFIEPIGQPRRLITLLRIDRVIEIRSYASGQGAASFDRDLRGDTAA